MADFGQRGAALWEQLGQASEFTPAGVLAAEACRLADRLEQLNEGIASGDPSFLSEARLHAGALKALLESPALKVAEPKGASGIDALAARRAARRSAASGS